MNENSYVKNLGQVAAIVFGTIPPEITYILWYDENDNIPKYYDPGSKKWVPISGALVSAENLVTEGKGLIYKKDDTSSLKFRRIKGINGINVDTVGDDVVISISDFMDSDPRELEMPSVIDETRILKISSNVNWVLINTQDPNLSWVEFDQTSGEGTGIVTLKVLQQNPSSEKRPTVTILLRDQAGNLDDVPINITQLGSQQYEGMYEIGQGGTDKQCEER